VQEDDASPIEENRFGLEPEITMKIASGGCEFQVGISYSKDGVRALWCLSKYAIKEPCSALPPCTTPAGQ
jgi:hypothetical protein